MANPRQKVATSTPTPGQATIHKPIRVISPWIKSQIVPPVNIPIPTKIGSKMGGAPTPKWDSIGFDPQPQCTAPMFDAAITAIHRPDRKQGIPITRRSESQSKPRKTWSTQNHASRIKKADIRNYFWLELPLTNLDQSPVFEDVAQVTSFALQPDPRLHRGSADPEAANSTPPWHMAVGQR